MKLSHKGRTILNADLPVTGYGWDSFVIAEAVFTRGANMLSLVISGQNPESLPFLVLLSCEAMSTV